MLYLDFAKKLQKKLDTDRVDLMDYEIQAYDRRIICKTV